MWDVKKRRKGVLAHATGAVRTPAALRLPLAGMVFLLAAGPVLAWAQEPEMIKDLGPGDGEWQLDYTGQFGGVSSSREGREHSGQSFYGLTDAIAIGGETMLGYRDRPTTSKGRLFFDYDSAVVIVRFRDPVRDPVGVGLWLQAGLDDDGEVARLEARAIVEKRSPLWWAQANVAYRRVNEGQAEGTYLAYAGQVSHRLVPRVWFGIEASGQAAKVSGFGAEPLRRGQYAGPRLASEFGLSRRVRARLGLSYLRRLDGDSTLGNTVQLSGGLRF